MYSGGDETVADEAFSRVAVKLYRQSETAGETALESGPWLRRVVYTTCIDVFRERMRRREEDLGVAELGFAAATPSGAGVVDPERRALARELQRVLSQSIAELPERLQSVVVERLGDASYRQIADRLMITEAGARKRMQEARGLLRARLAAYRRGQTVAVGGAPSATASGSRRKRAAERLADDLLGRRRAVRGVVGRLAAGASCEPVVELRSPPPAGDPVRLRRRLESYVARHPGGWRRRRDLAWSLLLAGEPAAAAVQWEEVVTRQPRLPRPWLELGRSYRLAGRGEAAAEAWARGAERCSSPLGRRLLGALCAVERGDAEPAEGELAALCAAAPESAVPWLARADLAARCARPTALVAAVDAALERAPDDASALVRGWPELVLCGRGREIAGRAERALEVDPENLPALLGVYEIGVRRGAAEGPWDGETARRRQAVEGLAQERADAAAVVAFAELRRGAAADARRRLEAFERRRPLRLPATLALAALCDLLGDRAAVLAALERIELPSGERRLDVAAVRLSGRAGDRLAAERRLAACREAYGDAWDVAAAGAAALAAAGCAAERVAELSRLAVAAAPTLPAAWIEHGRLLATARCREAAAAALRRGCALLPPDDGGELAVAAFGTLAALGRVVEGDEPGAERLASALGRLRLCDPIAAAVWADSLGSAAGPPPPRLAAVALAAERRRILTHGVGEASFP